jgi:hypothetical protein
MSIATSITPAGHDLPALALRCRWQRHDGEHLWVVGVVHVSNPVEVRLSKSMALREGAVTPDQRKVVLTRFTCRVTLRDQRAGGSHQPLLH